MLQLAHQILDAQNAYILFPRCKLCGRHGYDGDGLLHTDECVLRRIRKLQVLD